MGEIEGLALEKIISVPLIIFSGKIIREYDDFLDPKNLEEGLGPTDLPSITTLHVSLICSSSKNVYEVVFKIRSLKNVDVMTHLMPNRPVK